jgi:hypothetical protein
VPGTEAYRLREGDAEPDEIALIGEKTVADVPENSSQEGFKNKEIPLTVVEEVEGEPVKHSEEYEKRHKADAPPDLVLKPDGKIEGSVAGSDVPGTDL